ncbi:MULTISPECIES: Uma2 family endonuclease [Sorangium]|nr:Uma2 family endonuclease [Sorangium cellulosum]
MGQPAEKQRRATYADLEAVPSNKVAELIGGELHITSRSAPRNALARSALLGELRPGARAPRDHGHELPGDWWILNGPELHFPDRGSPDDMDVLVPDLVGWRRERMPELPETAYVELAPDWICDVLDPLTEEYKRQVKMPIYAREGVRHAWLVDPIARTLEVHVLGQDRRWGPAVVHHDSARVRVEPFEAIELDLSVLWAM